jgi:hypothetical protein
MDESTQADVSALSQVDGPGTDPAILWMALCEVLEAYHVLKQQTEDDTHADDALLGRDRLTAALTEMQDIEECLMGPLFDWHMARTCAARDQTMIVRTEQELLEACSAWGA